MYDYWPCQVMEVHDGDTIKFRCDLGLDTERRIWVRLDGVWCPELSDPGGIKSREGVREMLMSQPDWRVRTQKVGRTDKERMSFIRYIAAVNSLDMEFSLNSWIISAGLGAPSDNS